MFLPRLKYVALAALYVASSIIATSAPAQTIGGTMVTTPGTGTLVRGNIAVASGPKTITDSAKSFPLPNAALQNPQVTVAGHVVQLGGSTLLNCVDLADSGSACPKSVGTTPGTVAAGDDSRITGAAQKASNLSDLVSAPSARSNIGAAASGANGDITSITGLTTPLPLSEGGTGGTDAATARTDLGLGTAATQNTGTSGANLCLLNASCTWSANQTWSANGTFSGTSPIISIGKTNASNSPRVDFYDSGNSVRDYSLSPSGGSSTPLAGTLTLSGSKTTLAQGNLLTSSQTVTYDGSSDATKGPLQFTTGLAGSTPTNQLSPFKFLLSSDNAADSSEIEGFMVQHTMGGTAFNGTRSVGRFNGTLSVVSPALVTAAQAGEYHAFVGLTSQFAASINAGGLGGSTDIIANPNNYLGGVFAGNDNTWLISGATHWKRITGREIDVSVQSGADVREKFGLSIVHGSIDTARGLADDAGIVFADQGASGATWKLGVSFGDSTDKWAFGTDSTLIGTNPSIAGQSFVALNGVDWSGVTFQSGGCAYKSTGFCVDPSGNLTAHIAASQIDSGTLLAARLPNPTVSTLGGVESLTCSSHQWVSQISTSGVPSCSQPDVTDLVYNSGFHPGFVSGRYYSEPVLTLTTMALASNTLYAIPFYVNAAQSFTKASVDITATGTATSCELGYYANSSGAPGSRVSDLGSISATGTGQIELTGLSIPLNPGFYFLGVGCNGTVTMEAGGTGNSLSVYWLGMVSGTNGDVGLSVAWTYSAGNLPNPFGTATYTAGAAQPLVYLRL
jgi:hypothetical protein